MWPTGFIKEENVNDFKVEPNDFTCQTDFPLLQSELHIDQLSLLDFNTPGIRIKREINNNDHVFELVGSNYNGFEDVKNTNENTISNESNVYLCDLCKTSFALKPDLKCHMKLVHTSIYACKYKCLVCKKKFACSSKLYKHAKSHIGKISYTCEKRYKCNICHKMFARSDQLIVHNRVHTGVKPFMCDICLKTFAHKSTLTLHSRVHTGDKPYTCDVCSKKFALRVHMVRHSRIHTNDRPHTCNVCFMSYIQKFELVRHAKVCS